MTDAHNDLLARLATALSGDVELSRTETETIWDEANDLVAEAERLRADAKVAEGLRRELNDLFGWGDESLLHASLHVRNALFNQLVDCRAEERAAVVAWLRLPPQTYLDGYLLIGPIERGEHRKEKP